MSWSGDPTRSPLRPRNNLLMMSDSIQPRELQVQLQSLSQPHAPLIVDIRSHRQFRRTRIPGSHNITAARLISTEFPDRDLVLVGAHDDDTSNLVSTLYDRGFPRRIQHLQGGLSQWSAAGLPLEVADPEPARPREQAFPWWILIAGITLLLGLQQLSPGLVTISLVLLLTPWALSAWLQRNLFKLQRRAS